MTLFGTNRAIKAILDEWRQHAWQLNAVRCLESPDDVFADCAYSDTDSLIGYKCLIDAYTLLNNNLTPSQKDKMDKISSILAGLAEDASLFDRHSRPEPSVVDNYVNGKLARFRATGEIYINGGNFGHGNVVKIQRTRYGLTYTRYDAGEETTLIGFEGNKPVVQAIAEYPVRSGISASDILLAELNKRWMKSDSEEYKKTMALIGDMLGPRPTRAVLDLGQGKGNCSTRRQRLLISDLLNDRALSKQLHRFVSDRVSVGDKEIERALERKANRSLFPWRAGLGGS